jgi:hypothetical protein
MPWFGLNHTKALETVMLKPSRPGSLVNHISQNVADKTDLPPTRGNGEYLLMQSELPNANVQIGVLLLVADSDRLYCRFRRDFEEFAGDEAEWFKELPERL